MKIRVLAPEEHDKIGMLGPFASIGHGPNPDHSSIVVAEDEATGEILGYWCAVTIVHLEPLWVSEDSRGNGVGMALWGGLRKVLVENNVPSAFALVGDGDVMTHLPLANRLGFKRIPATALFIDLTKDPSNDGRGN